MSEQESAHGKLSAVDKKWQGNQFMVLFVITLGICLVIIYTIASIKSGDWSWHPFAHDIVRHTIDSSSL